MKFRIEYCLQGVDGQNIWVPNKQNPVEADSLKSCLARVAEGLPDKGMVEVIGIEVSLVREVPNHG